MALPAWPVGTLRHCCMGTCPPATSRGVATGGRRCSAIPIPADWLLLEMAGGRDKFPCSSLETALGDAWGKQSPADREIFGKGLTKFVVTCLFVPFPSPLQSEPREQCNLSIKHVDKLKLAEGMAMAWPCCDQQGDVGAVAWLLILLPCCAWFLLLCLAPAQAQAPALPAGAVLAPHQCPRHSFQEAQHQSQPHCSVLLLSSG